MTPRVFTIPLLVGPQDIDTLRHVNNVVYLRWVGEVAGAHWRAQAPPDAVERLAWVVTRHEIDYLVPAFDGETLEARTWVDDWTGVTSIRQVEILRPGDGTLLCRCRTTWAALDRTTGRPARIRPDVIAAFQQ